MKLTLDRWEAAALYAAVSQEILYQSGGEWHAPGDTEVLEGVLSAVNAVMVSGGGTVEVPEAAVGDVVASLEFEMREIESDLLVGAFHESELEDVRQELARLEAIKARLESE